VVRKDGLGTVTVARKSVRQVAQYEAAQIAGVREVRSEVRNGADGIHIITHASLAPDTVAPAVGEQLQVNIKEAVQRHLGLPVAEVQVHTQVEALDTTRRVR
jgi:uncharacterized alkaline shock family protein YloU